MPIRPTVSVIEASIMPPIKQFLESRTRELSLKKSSDPAEGTDMLAEAIALGIAKALAHPSLELTFSTIVDTNATAIIPTGKIAYASLKLSATIPTAPNPNLSRPY